MALTVKKITLWRGEVANRPGTLGKVLGPRPPPARICRL